MEAKRRLKEEQAKAKRQANALPVWISQRNEGVWDINGQSSKDSGVENREAEDSGEVFNKVQDFVWVNEGLGMGVKSAVVVKDHLLNLGALVDSPVTHQEHKGIITKLYDFYKRSLETEPGEEEPQVPSATELCSVLPNIQADDPSITTTQAEEPTITTTQAAEIEASSDSVSKTIKHQLSHQSIQNTLPPTKRHSKRLQALPKTQAGRVLQGFQSSYSLRNPTGQGLIPQGGIPISAEDCEQIQENEKSTDNVPVTQEKTDEQPLFRDEEQLESETHVPTEEAPITSGSQQTLPAGLRFQKKTPHQKEAPQLNINHFLPRQSTSKSVSQTCSELIREGSTSSSECALLL
ncbi:hypothetical protein BY996DRAFT_8395837 [Phakopsora pachyrhizi]|nr:hypothetical protein BY996DRAFT_8395837 [Phakopsora pachyrhizi]